MPCRYDPSPQEIYESNEHHFEHNSTLAEILCSLMKDLSADGLEWKYTANHSALLNWWEAHKERDRKKKEEENRQNAEKKLKINALKKLTPEEKEILGIG